MKPMLTSRSVYPGGSFDDRAAMRAPVIGLYHAHRPDELERAVRESAEVTHAHPLAIEGALLVATATVQALHGAAEVQLVEVAAGCCVRRELRTRLDSAISWLQEDYDPPPREIADRLGNGTAAAESCATALYLAARHMGSPFESLLRLAVRCRGDVDTILAMAGAIWGASNGAPALPQDALSKLEEADALRRLALKLYDSASEKMPHRSSSARDDGPEP